MTTIKATVTETLTEALELQKEITGGNFFDGFQWKPMKGDEERTHYVEETTGDIYYVYEYQNGKQTERLFHKQTLHSTLSDAGFNSVSIMDLGNGTALISITAEGWANTPSNRKIIAKHGMIITTLAA